MKEFEVVRDGMTPNRALYQCLMQSISGIPGVFAEFGVYKGDTFKVIMEMAERQRREAHAFDSFTGMAPPKLKGDEVYPEGTFDVGGPDEFIKAFPKAIIHPGFVSTTIRDIVGYDLAFAHIDLDQRLPTEQVLPIVWSQIAPGGIMACHDFRFGQFCRAAGAISEWYNSRKLEYEGLSDLTIWFRKPI